MKKGWLCVILALLAIVPVVSAETYILNSEDWRDVYSGTLYGSLLNEPTHFLVSDKHGPILLNSVPSTAEVVVFSSRRNPFLVGYGSIVRSKGYNAEEIVYDNFNLELAERLQLNNYIILDDAYGYNAISVAPYAVISDSYVIFADENNINEVEDFLATQSVDNLIIYGRVDREVRDSLSEYNPEIIDNQGDRFDNNIEIVKKYQELSTSKQTILTNGEFIEKEIMSGAEPVIFIGANNVPEQVKEYIQSSDIDIGVLIGNELVGTATDIRRQVGISVFVKFAQGARAPQGAISQVEALDMFYLPRYNLNIELDDIRYNKATDVLEVSLRNSEDQAVYLKGSYSLTDSNDASQTVGDADAVFLDGNELKTFTYSVEPLAEGNISGEAFVIYGESSRSMEQVLDSSFQVNTIEILDDCEVRIREVVYDKGARSFIVDLENVGSVTCFADSEVVDLVLDRVPTTVSSEDVIEIAPGKTKSSEISVRLEEEDIEDNEILRIRAYYGERETSLIKVTEAEVELVLKTADYLFFTLIAIIIALLILIVWKRRKKKNKPY